MKSLPYLFLKMKKKHEIQTGIIHIDSCKDVLFKLKNSFYGDFKYCEELKRVPDPNKWIQDAIHNLEQAIGDAMKIQINSMQEVSKE